MTLARKHSKYNVPQQFVERNAVTLEQARASFIQKKTAMSFLPSVECGKFKLKKAFQSGKILACTKNLKSVPHLLLS